MKHEQLLEIAQGSCGLKPNAVVVAGVSGGPDSLCLLHGLARLGFPLAAAYFDHQLRPDSARDGETVRSVADGLGIPFVMGRGDVAAFADQARMSVEEAARTLRYRFLFEQARARQAQAVAVGHTADDQVETVLMHLLRGSGLSGLTGMPFRTVLPAWDAKIPLVRPLLAFWREETLAYCQSNGLEPIFDPTNQETRFFRNRLRHELIPILETYNPQIRPVLWRTAQALAGDAQIVQSVVMEAWQTCFINQGERSIALRLAALRSLDSGVQRGVLRLAASRLNPALRDLDFNAVERAGQLIERGTTGESVDLVQGMRGLIEGEHLVIAMPGPLPNDLDWPQFTSGEEHQLQVPGQIELDSGWRLASAWAEPGVKGSDPWEVWLDAGMLPSMLSVRTPRAGDRFQPLGMEGHSIKLSDFWINQKLPRRARAGWPLVIAGDTIAWVPGYRPAHPFRIKEGTKKAVYLRVIRPFEM